MTPNAVLAMTSQAGLAHEFDLLKFPIGVESKRSRVQIRHGWHVHE